MCFRAEAPFPPAPTPLCILFRFNNSVRYYLPAGVLLMGILILLAVVWLWQLLTMTDDFICAALLCFYIILTVYRKLFT